ncbi:helix-turn-helix domain-containing protein [Portibacter marinus]|uniref:helix-turn-helix domain-containing protein n=1 Tax=Portibacter marinus TaxID=2898660 RepID=UPI001F2FF6CA|nr:helix-turn-helix domain-containing protein [Portibacter marinus]
MTLKRIKKSYLLKKSCRHGFQQKSEIIFIEDGKGCITINGQVVELQNKQVLVLLKGQNVSNIKSKCTGYSLRIKNGFFHQNIKPSEYRISLDYLNEISYNNPLVFSANYDKIVNLISLFFSFDKDIIQVAIKPSVIKTILKILSAEDLHELGKNNRIVDNFISMIKNDIYEYSNVSHYSKKLKISSKFLYKRCNKVLGKSPKVIIDNIKIEMIKRDLLSGKTIKQVVYAYNFSDHSHFTKYFKKKCGLTPIAFIRKRKKRLAV